MKIYQTYAIDGEIPTKRGEPIPCLSAMVACDGVITVASGPLEQFKGKPANWAVALCKSWGWKVMEYGCHLDTW